jgi:hypothetical protein
MSDHYLIVIPADPTFVPTAAAQQAAARLAEAAFPDADEITLHPSERVEFVYALGNCEAPACPLCGADLETWFWPALDRWAESGDAAGLAVTLPCCGRPGSLNDLAYPGGFPQGFARFQLSAMNPKVGAVGPDQLRAFGNALGCDVRVVYRRI